MALMRRWITEWTGPGHSPKLTIMHARADVPINPQLTTLYNLWNGFRARLSAQFGFLIPYDVEIFDDATGQLVGQETASGSNAGVGSTAAAPVPDSSQILIRWRTGAIVNGRRVHGRSFVPGCGLDSMSNGNLASSAETALQGFTNTFVNAQTGFTIWHRPTAGADGLQADILTSDVWNEFAVQRRRRG